MEVKKYYLIAGLLAILVNPIIVTAPFFYPANIVMLGIPVLIIPLVWIIFIKRYNNLPKKLYQTLLPIFIAFIYYMSVWLFLFGIHNDFEMNRTLLFMVLTFPYIGLNMYLAFADAEPVWLPFIYIIVMMLTLVPILIMRRCKQKR